jgi:hypothetical protein
MRAAISAFLILSCAVTARGGEGVKPKLPYRWVFCFGHRRNRQGADKVKAIIDTGAKHGLNGAVLSSFGLDSITRWPKKDVALLEEIVTFCAKRKVELIPTGFSAGYGGGALGHDRSFAAALPAKIDLIARGGKAVPTPGPNLFANGGLEKHRKGRFTGWGFHDAPGRVTFVDAAAKSGKACIRFENFASGKHGHGRIMQKITVEPGRAYRFSLQIRTEKLEPVSAFKLMVLREGGAVASLKPRLKSTADWTEISLEFVNVKEKELRVYAGVWGGKRGKFWLDDLRVSAFGTLSDIVRRKGTPLELRSAEREMEFEEGKDFRPIRNLRSVPHVALAPGTRIKPGEKLTLSCYKTPYVSHSWGRQISLCMSNPKLYEYWEKQARRIHEVFKYRKVLLAMDEIRNGGGCESCRKRGVSMAEILGDCITRQREIFRKIDPKIEVLIWSDMLDPAHNARKDYYGVVGDFSGSWRHVPRDLIIMCWYHRIRDKSLPFFSGKGFRTFGAAYYDAKDLTGSRQWLESLIRTPKAQGIMYTTWERKYELLGPFGDMVSGK